MIFIERLYMLEDVKDRLEEILNSPDFKINQGNYCETCFYGVRENSVDSSIIESTGECENPKAKEYFGLKDTNRTLPQKVGHLKLGSICPKYIHYLEFQEI